MEAMSEQQQTGATPTASNPLSPPLPLAGERSPTESGVAQRSANVAARAEDSLLGAKPVPESPAAESTEAAEQAKPQQQAVEQPAKPSYTDFKLPDGVAVDAEALKPATEL